jgi:hypothetical protein
MAKALSWQLFERQYDPYLRHKPAAASAPPLSSGGVAIELFAEIGTEEQQQP